MSDEEDEEEEFFCEAKVKPRGLPLSKVLALIQKDLERSLEPATVSRHLLNENLLSSEHATYLENQLYTPHHRCRELINFVRMCGGGLALLVRFHKALLSSNTPGHCCLARIFQIEVLRHCKNIPCPILYPDQISDGTRSYEVVNEMARRIPNVEVDREAAQSLKSALGLDNYIPPGYTMIDVSSIVMDWISTGNCRPDKLVQALTLTKGLGQYVSRLSCPWNPPEVYQFLTSCENKVSEVVEFLGYPRINESDCRGVIRHLLKEWKFPDCGDYTSGILRQLQKKIIPDHPNVAAHCEKDIIVSEKVPWPIDAEVKLTAIIEFNLQPNLQRRVMVTASPLKQPETFALLPLAKKETKANSHQQPETSTPLPETKKGVKANSHRKPETSAQLPVTKKVTKANFQGKGTAPCVSLHEAVKSCCLEVLEHVLKDVQQDVNERGEDSKTPLMLACQLKNLEAIRRLLHKGAKPNLKDKNGFGCLHYAETLESTESIFLLVQYGADIEIESNDHMTPLAFACFFQYEKAIVQLLQFSANINGSPFATVTPLSLATQLGYDSIVQCIIDSDVNKSAINAVNQDGSTALIKACEMKQTEIAIKLITAGADVQPASKDGCTAVFFATHTQNTELIQLLIIYNAELNKVGTITCDDRKVQLTPLSIAAACGNLGLVQIFVENRADVNLATHNCLSPIWWATFKNHPRIVEYLLKLNEIRKDMAALGPVIDLVVTQMKYDIGRLILTSLGGEEKATQKAKGEGVRIETLVSIMIEGIKQMEEEQRSESSSQTLLQHVAIDSRDEFESGAAQCFNEFVLYSIETFLLDRNLEEAIDEGLCHSEFFKDFSESRNQPQLFQQFIQGPSDEIFNSRFFTGQRFSRVLSNNQRLNFLEDLQAAFLHYAFKAPRLRDIVDEIDGKTCMKLICGERFIAEVTREGLFDVLPAEALPHHELREEIEYDQNATGTRMVQQSPENSREGPIDVAPSVALLHEGSVHNENSDIRIVPARKGFPAIRIRKLSSNTGRQSSTLMNTSNNDEEEYDHSSNEDVGSTECTPSMSFEANPSINSGTERQSSQQSSTLISLDEVNEEEYNYSGNEDVDSTKLTQSDASMSSEDNPSVNSEPRSDNAESNQLQGNELTYILQRQHQEVMFSIGQFQQNQVLMSEMMRELIDIQKQILSELKRLR